MSSMESFSAWQIQRPRLFGCVEITTEVQRKFEAYKYYDVNYWNEFRGSRIVFIDFIF